MQKLITIRLDHDGVEEQLCDYLADGWRVKQLAGVGMTSDPQEASSGFLAVVIEKKE